MRITLLGHRDVASLHALDTLIHLLPEHEFTAFTSTSAVAASGGPLGELERIDQRLFREYLADLRTAPELREAAELDSPNSGCGLDQLSAAQPDLIVSIRYRRILHDAAIAIPRLGVLNLHSGVLPEYRGVMATFWAMLNDEPEIGCTLHRIVDAGIDTGPVIAVSRQPTACNSTYLRNVLSLYAEGCGLVEFAVRAIGRGDRVGGRPQAAYQGRYYSAPDAPTVDGFRAKGLTLADGHELSGLRRQTNVARSSDHCVGTT